MTEDTAAGPNPLVPGTTLFVMDAPILRENTHSDFTVFSNDVPDGT